MTENIRYGRKPKCIKKAIHAKIKDWLDTIEDEHARKLAADNVIVTGGSIASMLLGEKVNDFDVYFKTFEAVCYVAKHYVNRFITDNSPAYIPEVKTENERCKIFIRSDGIAAEGGKRIDADGESSDDSEGKPEEETDVDAPDSMKYRPIFLSANAITLSNKIQLIVRFYGDPATIHGNFDFQHAMCYYDYKEDRLELPAPALECLLSRTLVYRGSLYPICSLFRMKKFILRGWNINAGEILKMAWQISELDLKDRVVLEEQLTGVDQAYMFALINALQSTSPDKLCASYVVAVIDKIFG